MGNRKRLGENPQKIGVTMSQDLYSEIENLADKNDRSVASMIRTLIKNELNKERSYRELQRSR